MKIVVTSSQQLKDSIVELIRIEADQQARFAHYCNGDTAKYHLSIADHFGYIAAVVSSIQIEDAAHSKSDADDVIRELKSDRFIWAIKLHRQYTKWGLKESKDACERYREKLRTNPDYYEANLRLW